MPLPSIGLIQCRFVVYALPFSARQGNPTPHRLHHSAAPATRELCMGLQVLCRGFNLRSRIALWVNCQGLPADGMRAGSDDYSSLAGPAKPAVLRTPAGLKLRRLCGWCLDCIGSRRIVAGGGNPKAAGPSSGYVRSHNRRATPPQWKVKADAILAQLAQIRRT